MMKGTVRTQGPSYARCLGAVLRYFREAHALTTVELAKRMNITASCVTQTERVQYPSRRKDYVPSVGWLMRWSKATSVPLGHVFTLTDRLRWKVRMVPRGTGCTIEEMIAVAMNANDGTIVP